MNLIAYLFVLGSLLQLQEDPFTASLSSTQKHLIEPMTSICLFSEPFLSLVFQRIPTHSLIILTTYKTIIISCKEIFRILANWQASDNFCTYYSNKKAYFHHYFNKYSIKQISLMQSKGVVCAEKEYKKLKQDYDELLQKNQNDLIKIKMREKQLNDKIAGIQKQNDELRQEVQSLKRMLKKQEISSKSIQDREDHQAQLKELKATISNKNKEIDALKKRIADLMVSEEDTKKLLTKRSKQLAQGNLDHDNQMSSMRVFEKQAKELQKQTEERFNSEFQKLRDEMNQKLGNKDFQLKNLQVQSQERLNKMITQHEGVAKKLQKTEDYAINLQQQIQIYQQQIDQIMKEKEEKQNQPCQNCTEIQQKLQLHQQMLRSVNLMLKFKEMELQKLKK